MEHPSRLSHDFMWSIENFGLSILSGKHTVDSDAFYSLNIDGNERRCRLYSRAEGKIDYRFGIIPRDDVILNEKHTLPYRVFLVKADGSETILDVNDSDLFKTRRRPLISKEKLFGNRLSYLPKDTLTLVFRHFRKCLVPKKYMQTTAHTTRSVEEVSFDWSIPDFYQYEKTKTSLSNGNDLDGYELIFRFAQPPADENEESTADERKVDDDERQVIDDERQAHDDERQVIDEERQVNDDERQVIDDERQVIDDERQADDDERQVDDDERQVDDGERQVNDDERQAHDDERQVDDDERQVHDDERQVDDDERQVNDDERKVIDDERKVTDAIQILVRQRKPTKNPVYMKSRLTVRLDCENTDPSEWLFVTPENEINCVDFVIEKNSTAENFLLFQIDVMKMHRDWLTQMSGYTLKLHFEFLVSTEDYTSEVVSSSSVADPDAGRKLHIDLKNMLKSSIFPDVRLRAKDGKERVGHKWILASRSRVFRDKLECVERDKLLEVGDGRKSIEGGKESNSKREEGDQKDVLEFPDLDFATLSRMVDYMYTDRLGQKVISDFKNCYKMYCGADSYELPSLKDECLKCLVKRIDSSNVFEALILAGDSNDGRLRLAALDFVYGHRDVVLLSDEWQDFSMAEPVLADNVLCHLRIMRDQDSSCSSVIS